MLTNEDLSALKWEDDCQDNCYSPFNHSHKFTLGKEIKKQCSKCSCEMSIDAQIFGNEFGRNRARLYNAYKCVCGHTDYTILYDGQPRGHKDIFEIAEKNVTSIL